MPDGTISYRCPAEPADAHVRKGGPIGDRRPSLPVQRADRDSRPRSATPRRYRRAPHRDARRGSRRRSRTPTTPPWGLGRERRDHRPHRLL